MFISYVEPNVGVNADVVVVDDNASDDLILECAKVKLIDKITNELHENVEDIVDDVEVPYDVEFDK